MLKITRQEELLDYISKKRTVSFEELNNKFNVSMSTIRRDLFEISKNSPVNITRGGVVYNDNTQFFRNQTVTNEKLMSIGLKACELIEEHDTIFIDAGRTTYHLAKAIIEKKIENITIVTTNFAAIDILSLNLSNINLIVVGGEFAGYQRSALGPIAEDTVSKIKTNKIFIGTTGITTEGMFTTYLTEISLRKQAINASNKIVLLADDSKFKNNSGYLLIPLDTINTIVTNKVPEDLKPHILSKNIELFETDK